MNIFYIKAIFPIILFFIFQFSLDTRPRDEYLEDIIVEDFEESNWTETNYRIHGNPNILPELKKSKTLTSPNLISNTSLFLRFPKGSTNQNIEILFPNPRPISNFVIYFKFQIFANAQGGSLSILLEDARLEHHIVPIGNLNFSGWQEFIVKINSGIHQEMKTLATPSHLKILGVIYTTASSQSKNREDLLAIDDIYAVTLPKIKLPKNFMNQQ